jgi:hypothetical protein
MNDDYIYPPRAGKQQRIAITSAGGITALSEAIKGSGYVRVKAYFPATAAGSDRVDFQFGASSGMTQVVADATGSGNTVGQTFFHGEADDLYITGSDTHISWISSVNGFLLLSVDGRKSVSKDQE